MSEFNADIIAKIFNTVSIVPKKSNSDFLSNLYLWIQNDKLSLTATNEAFQETIEYTLAQPLEKEIKCYIKPDVAKLFKSFKDQVEIDFKDRLMIVKNNTFTATLKPTSVEEYDFFIKNKQPDTIFALPFKDAKQFLNTVFASLKEDGSMATREFTGVLIECKDNQINAVATNRMMLDNKVFNQETKDFYGIIEANAVRQLLKINAEQDAVLTFNTYYNDNNEPLYAEFIINDTDFTIKIASKIIQGRFPDYKQISIRKEATKATIPLQEFKVAVDRIYQVAKTETNPHITLTINQNLMEILYANDEGEESIDTIPLIYCDAKDEVKLQCLLLSLYPFLINTYNSDNIDLYWKDVVKPYEIVNENEMFVFVPVR
ncbi:DNA polymerase 3 beta subunit [Desulfurella amilsii]|uniref:Beta sliding clamp n=1 Tax=Desulfurella amilsii TaxID=1562698 RepID=A0A1X4XZ89_9BACT|nr:hypothetical protein [Desulfurella amilsii]OSS42862.1 DNA polymerase 3 beta subunit [Desulfurella amilsii]